MGTGLDRGLNRPTALPSSVANVFAVAAFQVEKRLAVVSSALTTPALPTALLSSLGLRLGLCVAPWGGPSPGSGGLAEHTAPAPAPRVP